MSSKLTAKTVNGEEIDKSSIIIVRFSCVFDRSPALWSNLETGLGALAVLLSFPGSHALSQQKNVEVFLTESLRHFLNMTKLCKKTQRKKLNL